MREGARFAKLFLFSPREAADACKSESSLRPGLVVYGVLFVVQLYCAWFDPLSYINANAPVRIAHGAGFWLKVAMAEPVMFLFSVLFVGVIVEWMRGGWLPLKIASTALWTLLPIGLAMHFISNKSFHRAYYLPVLLVWALPVPLLSRAVTRERWALLLRFMLGLNAIQLAATAVQFATVVPAHSQRGYTALVFASLVWTLWAGGVGISRLFELKTLRAGVAFFYALFAILTVPAMAFIFSLLPEEVLKVLLFG